MGGPFRDNIGALTESGSVPAAGCLRLHNFPTFPCGYLYYPTPLLALGVVNFAQAQPIHDAIIGETGPEPMGRFSSRVADERIRRDCFVGTQR